MHAVPGLSGIDQTSDNQSNASGSMEQPSSSSNNVDIATLKERIVVCLRGLAPTLHAKEAVEMLVPMCTCRLEISTLILFISVCSPHTPLEEFNQKTLTQMIEQAYDTAFSDNAATSGVSGQSVAHYTNPTLMIIQSLQNHSGTAPQNTHGAHQQQIVLTLSPMQQVPVVCCLCD